MQLHKTLHTLGISQMFVYRAVNRYNETSSVCDKKDLAVLVVFVRKRWSKQSRQSRRGHEIWSHHIFLN